jgi:protease IV
MVALVAAMRVLLAFIASKGAPWTNVRALFSSYWAGIDVFRTREFRGMSRNIGGPFRQHLSEILSMSLDSDVIVDRRRIRRKLTFWRVAAALIAIAAILTIGLLATPGGRGTLTTAGSIARINIEGLIRSDQNRVEALERLENSRAAAVVVHINSPGGTTAGSEQLYDALLRLKAKKPLVVVVEGLAASGGYITAIAADHIVAQQSSLVGSIGVLFQIPNFTELMKTVGVKVEEVKSSPLKAAPNGFEPTSPEARAALESLVKDSYAWFRGLVKERRGMDDALLEKVADGRVFTGRQAVELKLIDQLGDEKTAIAWLVAQKGIKADLPVRDYKLSPRFGDLTFLRTAAAVTLDALGLSAVARQIEQSGMAQAVDRFGLDGMLALWHPAGTD